MDDAVGGALPAAGLTCESCATQLSVTARFCSDCGSPVRPGSRSAEYKQVTVIFADVVRSMGIAAAVDIERFREIMTDLIERCAIVIRRYGGGHVEFTGDGVMAVFGAPIALEDHAFRACLAALEIQQEAARLATAVRRSDGVDLRVRVGLNSGRVIAGGPVSGASGCGAMGQQVGMAQRMESVAPPGAVLLSESTAHLVEHLTVLAEREWVWVKGADAPVLARRLLAISPRDGPVQRVEANLVGRHSEMATLQGLVTSTTRGCGGFTLVTGAPGVGKSRVAREAAAFAVDREVDVFWTFCEAHNRDVPFHVLASLLRTALDVADLDRTAARDRVRQRITWGDPKDLLLLDDLLGIADPAVPQHDIEPDVRRRRLAALIDTALSARTIPTLFVIEDAHWIDAVSDSMIADFLGVASRTPLMTLITARPEYRGPLNRVDGVQTIVLDRLCDVDTAELVVELLGEDPSVGELAILLVQRAAGNPFFAEEMVQELAQSEVLTGERGGYVCNADVSEVPLPATVQAAIEARIDRLTGPAKQTVNAASVIGVRFRADLLQAMGIDMALDEPMAAELIEQAAHSQSLEYAFRHPLIRAVAYESQLKADREQWHRLVAAAIETNGEHQTDRNAALIAEHLEAAGEMVAAYGWHMRAAAWMTSRDLDAARRSWERARRIADALPADEPAQLPMRIAPRTMLCATDYQNLADCDGHTRFAELRQLCDAAEDKLSLAIGMSGPATALGYAGRMREGSRLASEQMALLESAGNPDATMALAFVGFTNWFDAGELEEMERWAQRVVDLAAGDPNKGAGFGIGSPLAIALTFRGLARWWLGRPGWPEDLIEAVAMARRSNHPRTLAAVVVWSHAFLIQFGVLHAGDVVVSSLEEAVRTAEAASDEIAVAVSVYGLAVALLNRQASEDRSRGLSLWEQYREIALRRQVGTQMLPVIRLWFAREAADCGDLDAGVGVMRDVVGDLLQAGRPCYATWGIGVLVESLLKRGDQDDIAEAHDMISRLADLRTAHDWVILDMTLFRLRALLSHASGDEATYRRLVDRYCTLAESSGFEQHIAWARAFD